MNDPGNYSTIKHEGIVQKVNSNSVVVSISSSSACSGCHAEGSCSLSGREEKIIEVAGRYNVNSGDSVDILMKQSMGFKALLLGYLGPLIIVVIILIVLISLNFPELVSGLISLAALVPYYFTLYLFRKKVNKEFIFTLKV